VLVDPLGITPPGWLEVLLGPGVPGVLPDPLGMIPPGWLGVLLGPGVSGGML
jgi:hypothetical protein